MLQRVGRKKAIRKKERGVRKRAKVVLSNATQALLGRAIPPHMRISNPSWNEKPDCAGAKAPKPPFPEGKPQRSGEV